MTNAGSVGMLFTSTETVDRGLMKSTRTWEMSKNWHEEGNASIITLNPSFHNE
jgi:hypothetical protein